MINKFLIIMVLSLILLNGCGTIYNDFTQEDLKVIDKAIQWEIDRELCDKGKFDEKNHINMWCQYPGGYRLIGSRIEDKILEGIPEKPIHIKIYFEEYGSDEYYSYKNLDGLSGIRRK